MSTDAPQEQEERVRDLVRKRRLKPRKDLCERLLSRVGGRAWQRPRVFVSGKLYARYGLSDPWDPDARADGEDPVRMGPVSLRLGEERREPAPHLRPKEPKAKQQANPASQWRPNVPSAPPAPAPSAPRAPAPTPAPTTPAIAEKKPRSSGEFGGNAPPALRGPLPVRPDLGEVAGGRAPVPPQPRSTPGRRLMPTRAGRFSLSRPETPPAISDGPEVIEVVETPAPAALPEPLAPVEEILLEAAAAPAPAPPPPEPEKPVDRRPPGKPMGLDDLFGSMDGGRVRMRKKKEET